MPNNNNLVSHKNTNIYLPNTNMIHKYKNVFTRQKKVFVCTVIGCGAPHHQRRRKKEFERARSVGVALASSVVSVFLRSHRSVLSLSLPPAQAQARSIPWAFASLCWIRFCASFNSVLSPLFRHINQRRLPGLVYVFEVFFGSPVAARSGHLLRERKSL